MDEVVGLLRAQDSTTTTQMAEDLGISHRTLMRDLEVLKDKGLPIETARGRGGGVRLHRHWGVGKLALSYLETVDLLLSLAVMEQLKSPLLLGNLRSIRNKIAVSFTDQHRDAILALRKRIFVGDPASNAVLASYAPAPSRYHGVIQEAFVECIRVRLSYRDEQHRVTERTIEPQFLFLNWPVWYVLAWDHLREDIRAFRTDRIQSARILRNAPFEQRDREPFLKLLEGIAKPI